MPTLRFSGIHTLNPNLFVVDVYVGKVPVGCLYGNQAGWRLGQTVRSLYEPHIKLSRSRRPLADIQEMLREGEIARSIKKAPACAEA